MGAASESWRILVRYGNNKKDNMALLHFLNQALKTENLLIVLCLLAGAIHVLSPDHWMPTSVLAWQRGWRPLKLTSFIFGAMLAHVFSGFVIFLMFIGFLKNLPIDSLFVLSVLMMTVFTVARGLRFRRISRVYESGPKSQWAIMNTLFLLGPCESIIPVFVKTSQMGMGYLTPFLAFLIGTLFSGYIVIFLGRYGWNRPLVLPRWLAWSQNGMSSLPFAIFVAFGLTVLLQLPHY